MWNHGLDEVKAGIKIARRNINNLRYVDDTTLMAEIEEELKSLLMKVKVSPDVKNCLIGKDPAAGKDWRQEKATTEDEMVGWHQQLDGHEFEQALRVGDGQESLACCGSWGHKESDTTEQLNWTELNVLQAKSCGDG